MEKSANTVGRGEEGKCANGREWGKGTKRKEGRGRTSLDEEERWIFGGLGWKRVKGNAGREAAIWPRGFTSHRSL